MAAVAAAAGQLVVVVVLVDVPIVVVAVAVVLPPFQSKCSTPSPPHYYCSAPPSRDGDSEPQAERN
jgi:hypothetical protein